MTTTIRMQEMKELVQQKKLEAEPLFKGSAAAEEV